jgi:rhodanese-related sulfurtransferase
MKLISREELKEKLDRGDDFKLVMTLGEWAFRAKHIPGSLHLDRPEKIEGVLAPQDEIVVYCSNPICTASQMAYHFLVSRGYENVRRYAGGIEDWETAGYPIEGEMVEEAGRAFGK